VRRNFARQHAGRIIFIFSAAWHTSCRFSVWGREGWRSDAFVSPPAGNAQPHHTPWLSQVKSWRAAPERATKKQQTCPALSVTFGDSSPKVGAKADKAAGYFYGEWRGHFVLLLSSLPPASLTLTHLPPRGRRTVNQSFALQSAPSGRELSSSGRLRERDFRKTSRQNP